MGKSAKKLKNVFRIDLQFHGLIWENTEDGGESGILGDGPVTMRLDKFGGFTFPDGEIKVSNGCYGPILSNGGEESQEDDVKIDCCPQKDMLPL